jgi:hypothetical protein
VRTEERSAVDASLDDNASLDHHRVADGLGRTHCSLSCKVKPVGSSVEIFVVIAFDLLGDLATLR